MGKRFLERIEGKELLFFSMGTMLLLLAGAFAMATPKELLEGMRTIILSRDALITDYFELAGVGAAFLNATFVLGMGILLIWRQKLPFTGLTMAVLFINAGFALFGKNPVNVLPIIFGTWLYAKLHRTKMSRYVYTALFGSCLAPMVTEMIYLLPFSLWINFLFAVAVGILIGFVLPPLSMHTASMHMGYNLFNVGFAAGLLAFVMVCILQSFGLESDSVFIWKSGREVWMAVSMYLYFLLTFLLGLLLNRGDWKPLLKLTRHPGRAVADFVLMDGIGTTLMTMGVVGGICLTYILLIGGDLSGPVVGAILTAFGFASFGVHAKNYLPVLGGVFLSTFFNHMAPTTPGIQIGAIFAVGLAPVSGQFGIPAGILAGMLHAVVVVCTSSFYEGLNLYNNGFSTGIVAIVIVPMLESFIKGFKLRHKKREVEE